MLGFFGTHAAPPILVRRRAQASEARATAAFISGVMVMPSRLSQVAKSAASRALFRSSLTGGGIPCCLSSSNLFFLVRAFVG